MVSSVLCDLLCMLLFDHITIYNKREIQRRKKQLLLLGYYSATDIVAVSNCCRIILTLTDVWLLFVMMIIIIIMINNKKPKNENQFFVLFCYFVTISRRRVSKRVDGWLSWPTTTQYPYHEAPIRVMLKLELPDNIFFSRTLFCFCIFLLFLLTVNFLLFKYFIRYELLICAGYSF